MMSKSQGIRHMGLSPSLNCRRGEWGEVFLLPGGTANHVSSPNNPALNALQMYAVASPR